MERGARTTTTAVTVVLLYLASPAIFAPYVSASTPHINYYSAFYAPASWLVEHVPAYRKFLAWEMRLLHPWLKSPSAP